MCDFYELDEKRFHSEILRAAWDDLRVRDAGWICRVMAVFYWVENQAGERVGVENHPGSDYSGRQCRPLKDVARDVAGIDGCGLIKG